MNIGVLLGFLAYGAMAWGDAVIKAVGADRLSVFEIGFFVSIFAGIAMLFMRPSGERWRDLFKVRHPRLVALRSLSGIGAGIFGVVAFTSIPFAEAYALIFMSPFIVTLLSIRDGIIPATLNLEKLDPGIELDVVAGEPRKVDLQAAVCDSFGFGGHNAAVAFTKV